MKLQMRSRYRIARLARRECPPVTSQLSQPVPRHASALPRSLPGLGIAVPTILPGLLAVGAAALLHPVALAGLAYVAGTLGTPLGAGLFNLGSIRRLGAPVASVGGAGTFDGVFLAGLIAVLLAALLPHFRPAEMRPIAAPESPGHDRDRFGQNRRSETVVIMNSALPAAM